MTITDWDFDYDLSGAFSQEDIEPLRAAFNPHLHPRGRDGRFIEIGSLIHFLFGGDEHSGKVTKIDPDTGMLHLESDDGRTLDVNPGAVLRVNDVKASLKPKRGNQYTKWARDKTGPPAMTHEDAMAAGFTDGPYYHATNDAQKIMDEGFLTKGAETWEASQWGSVEEFQQFDSVNQVWLATDPADVAGYGDDTIEIWTQPGAAKEGSGSTFGGGLYVSDPFNVVPIIDSAQPTVVPEGEPVLIQGNKKQRVQELAAVSSVLDAIDEMLGHETDKLAIAEASKAWDDAIWDQLAKEAHTPPLSAEQRKMVQGALDISATKEQVELNKITPPPVIPPVPSSNEDKLYDLGDALLEGVERLVGNDFVDKTGMDLDNDELRAEVKRQVVRNITNELVDDPAVLTWASTVLDAPIPDFDQVKADNPSAFGPSASPQQVLDWKWGNTALGPLIEENRNVRVALVGVEQNPAIMPKTVREMFDSVLVDPSTADLPIEQRLHPSTPEHDRFLQEMVIEQYVNKTVRSWAISAGDSNPWSISMQEAVAKLNGMDTTDYWKSLDTIGQSEGTSFEPSGEDVSMRSIVEQIRSDAGPFQDAFTRTVYQHTQDFLAANGFKPDDRIQLHRGMRFGTPKHMGGRTPLNYEAENGGFQDPTVPDEIKSMFHWTVGWAPGDPHPVMEGTAVVTEHEPRDITIMQNPASSWTLNPETALMFAEPNSEISLFPVQFTSDVPVSQIYSLPVTGPGALPETEAILLGGEAEVSAKGLVGEGVQDAEGGWSNVPV